MNGRHNPQKDLELEIKNFGPIAKANVDIRPLTVFIGPSNTGKSYLAILIYALHRFFKGERRFGSKHYPGSSQIINQIDNSNELKRIHNELVNFAREITQEKGKSKSEESEVYLPDLLVNTISNRFEEWGNFLNNEINRCFGIKSEKILIRQGLRNKSSIIFRNHNENWSSPIEHHFSIDAHGSQFKTIIPDHFPVTISKRSDTPPFEFIQHLALELLKQTTFEEVDDKHFFTLFLLSNLSEFILPQFTGSLHLPAFYLPADRTGVMHAHRVVVSALLESAAMKGLRPAPAEQTPILSGVLADFLEQLISIENGHDGKKKKKPGLASQIENAILSGVVKIDKSETGYPNFTYQPSGWNYSLPLMNASSMVSELAPIILYLRHIVKPGGVMIVEEPESHLHPAMQVEFIRQIANLINEGIRVIITTHSEWVLEELSNIVMRSKDPTTPKQSGNIDKPILNENQMGVWLFRSKNLPMGSVVEEIKVDEEIGLYPSDYGPVSEELHNNSTEIFNNINNQVSL